jgi:hypothetical protein
MVDLSPSSQPRLTAGRETRMFPSVVPSMDLPIGDGSGSPLHGSTPTSFPFSALTSYVPQCMVVSKVLDSMERGASSCTRRWLVIIECGGGFHRLK